MDTSYIYIYILNLKLNNFTHVNDDYLQFQQKLLSNHKIDTGYPVQGLKKVKSYNTFKQTNHI